MTLEHGNPFWVSLAGFFGPGSEAGGIAPCLAGGSVKIPIIGMGGIMTAEDAVEFYWREPGGCVGTANFVNPTAAQDIADGIDDYLVARKLTNVSQLVGQLKINDDIDRQKKGETNMADNRLIAALDFHEMDEVKNFVEKLGDSVSCYKVGMELFYSVGARCRVSAQLEQGCLLDLKLHDIPNTTAEGLCLCRAWGRIFSTCMLLAALR